MAKTTGLACVMLLLVSAAGCSKEEKAEAGAGGETKAKVASELMKKEMDTRMAVSDVRQNVGTIARGVQAAAEKEEIDEGAVLKPDEEQAPKKLPEGTEPVPANADDVKGKEYTSKAADWESWKALSFKLEKPQKCQYQWQRSKDSEGKVVAKCDFDGDGKLDMHVTQTIAVVGDDIKLSPLNEIVAP